MSTAWIVLIAFAVLVVALYAIAGRVKQPHG